MKNPLTGFFEDDGDDLRQAAEVRIRVDPYGNPVIEPLQGEVVSRSDRGTIKHLKYTTDRYHPCGCSAQEPIGGRCREDGCGQTACVRCFRRCESCGVPLCVQHQRRTSVEGKPTVLCGHCLAKLKARRLFGRVAGLFVNLKPRREP